MARRRADRFELPDGGMLASVAFGDPAATTVVVVPGLTDGLAPLWHEAGREALDAPPAPFHSYHVVVVSHRHPLPTDPTTAGLARDLAEFCDARLDGPAAFTGHSMGAMVCQHLAADRSDLVDRLVLSSTVASADPAFTARLERWDRQLRDGRFRAFFDDAVAASFVGWRRRWLRLVLRLTPVHAPDDELVARHLALSHACRTHDATGVVPAIDRPTLVLSGTEDELTRPARAEELAALLPDAELVLVPGAGHGLPEQRARAYRRHIRAFLERSRTRG